MFGVGGICGVVRSRRTFIRVIGGVSMNRGMSISVIVNRVLGVSGRVIMSRRLSVSWRMGIAGRVSMSGFVNGDVSMSRRVIRAGAVNKGVIGHVIMSGVLGIVGRVNMSRFMNGDVSMGRHVIRAGAVNKGVHRVSECCRGAKRSVVVVSVGRSVVW